MHLSPAGRNVEAAKAFKKAGGTHMMLVCLPRRVGQTVEEQFNETISIAHRVREDAGVAAYAAVAPHPVELVNLMRHGKLPLAQARAEVVKSIDYAVSLIRKGDAVALGEIGRPHFPVEKDVLDASNEILLYALGQAKDAGCAVQLHTESGTPDVCRELAEMADKAGFLRERMVKHYSPPLVLPEENHGLFPSVLAGKEAVEKAVSQGTRFFLETDYLDDPKRPGAVLDIATVPKRVKWLLETGKATEEIIHKICRENPEKVYGIEMGG